MAVEENIVIKVAVDTAESQNTLQGLEDSIDELKKLRDGEQIGSKAFNDLSASIQKTEARIKDVELQFESLDFEQKLTAGTDAVNTLAGGFMVAEGAANLMGIQSESLERSLQKMAAAMSLTMGLRDMANGIIALRKLGGAAGLAKKGIDALNAAMKANPWGALLAAVVAVAAAVAVFVINSRNAAKALDVQLQKSLLLNEARVQAAKAIAQEKQNLDSLVKAAKDETLSKEARQEAIKQINEISPEYLGNITLETINSEDATIAINKYTNAIERKARAQAFAGKMAEIEAQILEKELMSNDELAKSRTGLLDVTKNSITFIKSKLSADEESLTMKETLIKLGKEDAQNEIAGLQVRKQALKELMESEQEALLQDEAFVRVRGKQIEATKTLTDAQKSLREEMEKEAEALKKIENAKTASINQMLGISNEAYQKEITNLRELNEALQRESEIRGESLRSVVGVQKEATDEVKEVWMTAWSEMAQMDIENREAEKARIEEGWNSRLDKAQQGIEFLGLINQAFIKDEEKREKIRKALAVAQIAVDTARGISAAVAAGAGVPFPANIPAIISGVSAVLAGIIQAKSVLGSSDATPSVDSAISGASAGGGGVPLNNISNTASLVDQQQQEITTQVVVLESDITTTQENVTAVSELSSF